MSLKRCLICYEELKDVPGDYHPRCSKKFFGREIAPIFPHKLDEMKELAGQEVNKSLVVTGVQKKISLGLEKHAEVDRLTIMGWGNFILKPPSETYPEMPENEDLTMHLAEVAGIQTVPHCLIRMASGELAYLTKRIDRKIDRKNKIKIHMEDMCQLTERLTEDKYKGSLEKVGGFIKAKCRGIDLINFYELVVFCFLTGNADMHLKNFSLLHAENGQLVLAPAYDLLATKLVNPADQEESALTLNGKKNKIKQADFHTLAERLKIGNKARNNAIERITGKLSEMGIVIRKSFISSKMKEEYIKLLTERALTLKGAE